MSAPITLTGRLVRDPELKFTTTGKAIARFTVVTSRRRKNGDQWEDVDTTFWPCTAWDQLAEQVCENFRQGSAVIISGSAYQNEWEKDGEKRSRIEVRVDAAGANLRWAKPADRMSSSTPAGDPWANGGTPDAPPF
ncbi:single-stranded DNA-binding protein [Streptosporangium sp. NPDC051022]|uniref:single-stranded DNA-binding protein n=1 Tax=Streptosporangium sp. NPDC051022 TaxID=3155752 RepID=UPI003440F7A3